MLWWKKRFLLDTSALIDGRILALHRIGLFDGILVIPEFIIYELQQLADSRDFVTRRKGERGLHIIKQLQEVGSTQIVKWDSKETLIDKKVIEVAKKKRCRVITTDAKMSDIAKIKEIQSLNVNAIAYAVRNTLMPGDEITLRITKTGTDDGQGVGYLRDGTMVVVEGGLRSLNEVVRVEITNIIDTAVGVMVFSKLSL